jgi:hypothetical protein
MSAFLFTGWARGFDPQRGLQDFCSSLILHDCELNQGQAWFEGWLQHGGRPDDAPSRKVERVVVSPIVDRLFTETGDEPLDWPALAAQSEQALTAGEEAYEQQGYWADCHTLVPSARLPFDLHQLQQSLPGDVRAGLNWSADAQNFFLVSALVIPTFAPAPDPDYENLDGQDPDAAENSDDHSREAPFPELAPREATAVVKARNTVVAAWLWRRYAAQTPLATNPIRVDGWCSVVGPEAKSA